ncbi:MAG: RNA methyltransferase, partial [Chloroflexia bacterium]
CLYNYDLVKRTERGRMLLKNLVAAKVTLLEATERAIEAASDTPHPQGIVAAFRFRSLDAPLTSSGTALGVVCDAVQDPGNLGTLLRSAEAAGAIGVWLTPGCVDPYSPKVVRAAMGAHFRLPIFSSTWPEIPVELEKLGIPTTNLYATEADADTPYDEVDWTSPSALVVSNEAHGLSQEAREAVKSARFISIPMSGNTESLNSAIAGSVILFEAARQRRVHQPKT